jgi:hypothetical protein
VREVVAVGDTEVAVGVLVLLNAVGWVGCADAKHTREAVVAVAC